MKVEVKSAGCGPPGTEFDTPDIDRHILTSQLGLCSVGSGVLMDWKKLENRHANGYCLSSTILNRLEPESLGSGEFTRETFYF